MKLTLCLLKELFKIAAAFPSFLHDAFSIALLMHDFTLKVFQNNPVINKLAFVSKEKNCLTKI